MNNSLFYLKEPNNEPVYGYTPQSEEKKLLLSELEKQEKEQIEIPLIIGGREIKTDRINTSVMPHEHGHVIAKYHVAGEKEIKLAIEESLKAKKDWMNLSWIDRATVMLKAAELISRKYRHVINAATMLGQSKSAHQSEIDAACELIDFLRFNAHFACQIYTQQPKSESGWLNRVEYRPLEGFVLAITPFNFTAIAGNLTTSAALMGNTVIWKPSSAAIPSNYCFMKILQEAGLPDGVINFAPSVGGEISKIALNHQELAGIHFTGSTGVFNGLWRNVGDNLNIYRSYPKVVGETGGKDFIFVHASADPDEVVTAIIRGAFEFQGQKCSAASRAYIPKSLWDDNIQKPLLEQVSEIKVGDVKDFSNFMNAVIDEKSFDNIMRYIGLSQDSSEATIIAGGKGDKTQGYFIEPTIILTSNPRFVTMQEEIFGPVMTIFVYDDKDYEKTLELCDQTSPYSLTGSIFAREKYAATKACETLRYAAGNFYINDKPTGSVVGQQPFGGSRASGTNDKAGSFLNLVRWVNPRTIKETYNPPTHYKYPFMEK